jgi:hypothetical protein
LEEFSRTFGERDWALIATTKLRTLQQRSRPASAYVAEFQQLACDLDWNDTALITMFRWGLRDDIKTLLLNLPKPTTLSEALLKQSTATTGCSSSDRSDDCSLDHIERITQLQPAKHLQTLRPQSPCKLTLRELVS